MEKNEILAKIKHRFKNQDENRVLVKFSATQRRSQIQSCTLFKKIKHFLAPEAASRRPVYLALQGNNSVPNSGIFFGKFQNVQT